MLKLTSSAVHSAMLVGFESAKMIGTSLNLEKKQKIFDTDLFVFCLVLLLHLCVAFLCLLFWFESGKMVDHLSTFKPKQKTKLGASLKQGQHHIVKADLITYHGSNFIFFITVALYIMMSLYHYQYSFPGRKKHCLHFHHSSVTTVAQDINYSNNATHVTSATIMICQSVSRSLTFQFLVHINHSIVHLAMSFMISSVNTLGTPAAPIKTVGLGGKGFINSFIIFLIS